MENDQSQILLLLGEIKGQMSGFMSSQAEANKRADDHEGRIRVLETNSSKQRGVVAGITIAASAVASGVGYVAHLILGK